jgi:hypothetical protein
MNEGPPLMARRTYTTVRTSKEVPMNEGSTP